MPRADRIRIVDFSTHVAGPVASHLLSEIGADVIKVERPVIGDGNRGTEPSFGSTSLMHVWSSGARSLVADAKSSDWSRIVQACAQWADAVIVGLRPIDAQRRGLDFASLRRFNSELVYCMISGYGETGPWRDLRAHGQNVDAYAGLASVEWADGMPKTPVGWRSTGTTLSGVFGALGVMAGLHHRDHGGGAQYVSTSMWASAVWSSWRDITCQLNGGSLYDEYRDFGTRYAMYPTSDGRVVVVAPTEQKFWTAFCNELGLPPEWKEFGSWTNTGMDHGKGSEYAHEGPVIADKMRQRSLTDWVTALSAIGIPFAPVLTFEEVLASEHATAEGVILTTAGGDGIRIPRTPLRFGGGDDETTTESMTSPPRLGEHTTEILLELGLNFN